MKHTKVLTFILAFVITFVLGTMQIGTVQAASSDTLDCSKDLSSAGKEIFCNNAGKVSGSNGLNTIIDNIANWLVGIIGFILVIIILISAIQIITSAGNPDAMKGAKNRLAQAAISIGFLVAFRGIIALLGIK